MKNENLLLRSVLIVLNISDFLDKRKQKQFFLFLVFSFSFNLFFLSIFVPFYKKLSK